MCSCSNTRPSSKFTEDNESKYPMYDLDELDLNWLDAVNQKRKFRGKSYCLHVQKMFVQNVV